MFFKSDDFSKDGYFTETQARAIAIICNDLVDKKGVLLYCRHYEDGSVDHGSTEREPESTHQVVGIALAQLGSEPPSNKPIKIDKLERDDEVQLLRDQIHELKKEQRTKP